MNASQRDARIAWIAAHMDGWIGYVAGRLTDALPDLYWTIPPPPPSTLTYAPGIGLYPSGTIRLWGSRRAYRQPTWPPPALPKVGGLFRDIPVAMLEANAHAGTLVAYVDAVVADLRRQWDRVLFEEADDAQQ